MAKQSRKPATKHTVALDKERDLTLDMAAIADIHEHAGVNLLQPTDNLVDDLMKPKSLSVVVWALIGGTDSDLTIREVQRHMPLGDMNEIMEAVVAVLTSANESNRGRGEGKAASPTDG